MEKRTIKILLAFSLFLLINFTSRAFSQDRFQFVSVWLANNGAPQNISLRGSGNILVKFDNNLLKEFSPAGNEIKNYFNTWPPVSLGNKLTYLSPDAKINHVLADPNNGKIYLSISNIVNPDNIYDHKIIVLDNNNVSFIGQYGSGNGEFNNPKGLALSSDGKLYVVDSNNYRVQIFNPDGTYRAQFGGKGFAAGQFIYPPVDLAIKSDGTIIVLDGFKIHQFSSDGRFISEDENSKYSAASAVTIDLKGNIHVVDYGQNKIISTNKDWAQPITWGISGQGPGQFNWPTDIAEDGTGNLYIVDYNNKKIEKYKDLLFNSVSSGSKLAANAAASTTLTPTATMAKATTTLSSGSLTLTSAPDPIVSATTGSSYRIVFTASGGYFTPNTNRTAWVISGTKPSWLNQSSRPLPGGSTSACTLSGIPPATERGKSYSFTINVTDDNGLAAKKVCSFIVD